MGGALETRALLFGLAAVQSGVIDAATLSSVLSDKGGPGPGDFRAALIERAGLSAADVVRLEAAIDALPAGAVEQIAAKGLKGGRDSWYLGPDDSAARYAVRSEHASGGMGRILLAHDNRIGRDVALKELLPGRADTEAATLSRLPSPSADPMAARFLQEARVTGQLEHPSIIPVYDVGCRSDGSLYYTMKFVRGRTLSEAIRAAGDLEGRLRLLPHFIDVCNAIAYAHSRGVIHRDLKPINIMVGEFGETVLLDWGLAKRVGEEGTPGDGDPRGGEPALADFRTQIGQVVGTPAYMAPEQAAGALDSVDERSDVYGLGAVLYELLTGKPPFSGATVTSVLRAVRGEGPAPVRSREANAPPELAAVCERALARSPAARYQAAIELRDEITRFQTGSLVETYRYSPPELAWRFVRRHWALTAALAASLAVIAAIGAGAYIRVSAERDLAETRLVESERLRTAVTAEEARAREALARQEREEYYHTMLLAEARFRDGDAGAAEALLLRTKPAFRHLEWGVLMHRLRSEDGRLHAEPAGLLSAALDDDGAVLATGGRSGGISFWEARSFASLGRIEDHRVYTALAPDGSGGFLAVDNGLNLYRTAPDRTKVEAVHLRDAAEPASAGIQVVAHGNGRWAYVVDSSWSLRRIDLNTGQTAARIAIGGRNAQIALDRAGERLLLTCWDAPVRLLDAETLETVWAAEMRGHVYAAAFSADESGLLLGAFTSLIFAPFDGAELGAREAIGGLHTQETVCIAATPDGGHVLTAGLDGRIRLIDAERRVLAGGAISGDPIGGTGERYGGLFVDAAGEYVYASSRSGTVRRWRLDTIFDRSRSTAAALKEPVPAPMARFEHGGRIGLVHAPRSAGVSTYGFGLAYNDSGSLLAASGTPRGAVGLIDGRTHAHLTEIVLDGDPADFEATERFIAFRPGRDELVIGSKRRIALIDVTGGREQARREINVYGTIYDGMVGESGRYAAAGLLDEEHAAVVADLETGAVRFVPYHPDLPTSVSIVALDESEETVYLGYLHAARLDRFDLRTGAWSALDDAEAGSFSLLLHPSEPLLIAGGEDGAVRVHDRVTGAVVRTFTGHAGHVTGLELSPDGRRLLTSGHDMTARIWDWETGQLLQTLENRSWFALDVRMHPQASAIAVTDADAAVLIYPLEPWNDEAD